MDKLRVGIVFGGRSVEHEVSIASATWSAQAALSCSVRAAPMMRASGGICPSQKRR